MSYAYTYRPPMTVDVDPEREARYLDALKRGEHFWIPSCAITGRDEQGHYIQVDGVREHLTKPKLAHRLAWWDAHPLKPSFRPYQ